MKKKWLLINKETGEIIDGFDRKVEADKALTKSSGLSPAQRYWKTRKGESTPPFQVINSLSDVKPVETPEEEEEKPQKKASSVGPARDANGRFIKRIVSNISEQATASLKAATNTLTPTPTLVQRATPNIQPVEQQPIQATPQNTTPTPVAVEPPTPKKLDPVAGSADKQDTQKVIQLLTDQAATVRKIEANLKKTTVTPGSQRSPLPLANEIVKAKLRMDVASHREEKIAERDQRRREHKLEDKRERNEKAAEAKKERDEKREERKKSIQEDRDTRKSEKTERQKEILADKVRRAQERAVNNLRRQALNKHRQIERQHRSTEANINKLFNNHPVIKVLTAMTSTLVKRKRQRNNANFWKGLAGDTHGSASIPMSNGVSVPKWLGGSSNEPAAGGAGGGIGGALGNLAGGAIGAGAGAGALGGLAPIIAIVGGVLATLGIGAYKFSKADERNPGDDPKNKTERNVNKVNIVQDMLMPEMILARKVLGLDSESMLKTMDQHPDRVKDVGLYGKDAAQVGIKAAGAAEPTGLLSLISSLTGNSKPQASIPQLNQNIPNAAKAVGNADSFLLHKASDVFGSVLQNNTKGGSEIFNTLGAKMDAFGKGIKSALPGVGATFTLPSFGSAGKVSSMVNSTAKPKATDNTDPMGEDNLIEKMAQQIAHNEGWYAKEAHNPPKDLNNPGDIRYHPYYVQAFGAVPVIKQNGKYVEDPHPKASDFLKFPTAEAGFAGLRHQIKVNIKRGDNPLQFFAGNLNPKTGKMEGGFSPKEDHNDPVLLAETMHKATGLDTKIPIKDQIHWKKNATEGQSADLQPKMATSRANEVRAEQINDQSTNAVNKPQVIIAPTSGGGQQQAPRPSKPVVVGGESNPRSNESTLQLINLMQFFKP